MKEPLYKKTRAAAVAAWWTFLVGVIIALIQWLGFMHAMRVRPEWIERMLGGMDWPHLQPFLLVFILVVRLIVFVLLLLAIWLSIWANRLRNLE